MYGTAQVTDGGSVDAQAARSPPYARLAFWGVVDGLLAYSNSAADRNARGDFSRRPPRSSTDPPRGFVHLWVKWQTFRRESEPVSGLPRGDAADVERTRRLQGALDQCLLHPNS